MCVLVIQWPFSTSFSSPITSRRKGGTRHLTKNSVRINRRILPFSSNCNLLPERIIHTANNPRVVSHFLEMKLNTLYIFERSSFSHRYSTFSFFFFFLFSVIKFEIPFDPKEGNVRFDYKIYKSRRKKISLFRLLINNLMFYLLERTYEYILTFCVSKKLFLQ